MTAKIIFCLFMLVLCVNGWTKYYKEHCEDKIVHKSMLKPCMVELFGKHVYKNETHRVHVISSSDDYYKIFHLYSWTDIKPNGEHTPCITCQHDPDDKTRYRPGLGIIRYKPKIWPDDTPWIKSFRGISKTPFWSAEDNP
jgi:hypothetical protein